MSESFPGSENQQSNDPSGSQQQSGAVPPNAQQQQYQGQQQYTPYEQYSPYASQPDSVNKPDFMGMTENTYCMLMHLSQLLSGVVPMLGVVAPIVMWAINKDKSPLVDRHGKVVFNWLISELIYLCVCIPLLFVLIGIPLVIVIAILGFVFPIIGGIKANDGIVWKYPLSIPFFKVDPPIAGQDGAFWQPQQ